MSLRLPAKDRMSFATLMVLMSGRAWTDQGTTKCASAEKRKMRSEYRRVLVGLRKLGRGRILSGVASQVFLKLQVKGTVSPELQ